MKNTFTPIAGRTLAAVSVVMHPVHVATRRIRNMYQNELELRRQWYVRDHWDNLTYQERYNATVAGIGVHTSVWNGAVKFLRTAYYSNEDKCWRNPESLFGSEYKEAHLLAYWDVLKDVKVIPSHQERWQALKDMFTEE